MPGGLTLGELADAVADGAIDTVLVAQVDMQGRLMGKRFQAEFFLESAHVETHGCNYLLATDFEMETVPGYKATSWAAGYGDYVMKPDLATLRRVPWLEGTALVLCDVLDHHGHGEVPHSPARDAQAADRPAARAGLAGDDGVGARVLPLRRLLRRAACPGLPRAHAGQPLQRGLSHLPDHARRRT